MATTGHAVVVRAGRSTECQDQPTVPHLAHTVYILYSMIEPAGGAEFRLRCVELESDATQHQCNSRLSFENRPAL